MIRNFLNCLKAIRVNRRFYSNSYRIAGVKTRFEIWYGQNELELASQLYVLDHLIFRTAPSKVSMVISPTSQYQMKPNNPRRLRLCHSSFPIQPSGSEGPPRLKMRYHRRAEPPPAVPWAVLGSPVG